MLSFEEFKAYLFAHFQHNLRIQAEDGRGRSKWHLAPDSIDKITLDTRLCGETVNTGGYSGGNCWDSSNSQRYTTDEKPTLDNLDAIFEEFVPKITFMQYRKFMREIEIKEEYYTEHEYYGNSQDNAYKYVTVGDFYNALSLVVELEERVHG